MKSTVDLKPYLHPLSHIKEKFIFGGGGGRPITDPELICNCLNRFVGDSNVFPFPRLEGDNGDGNPPVV